MPLVERPPFGIPEEDRARNRGSMDRMADGGVARDVGSAGTEDSAATRLDMLWWTGTAIEIFKRLPRAAGAGEGSSPAQNEGLAKELMSCFGALATDAGLLRVAFGAPSAGKAQLRETVAVAMAEMAGPALNALTTRPTALARPPSGLEAEPAEPAESAQASAVPPWVVAAAKKKKKKPSSYYPSESELIHGRRFTNAGRWRGVKNWREQLIREYVANPALQGNLKEFRERTDLQVKTWKNYYSGAAIIAARARGQFEIDDDYYDLPNPDEFGGLPSDKLIGNVVHEYLQQKYLNDKRLASHNVVSEVGRTVSYFVGGAPNARPKPQRIWDVVWDADYPVVINSLAWSLGYEGWHLRPDLVDLDDRNIFEIKPIRSAHKGVLQLWRYVSNFRMSWAFDDIVTRKPGAPPQGRREWELRLRFAPPSVLEPFELYPLLRKKRVATRYAKYKKVWVQPLMMSSLPGLLMYRLQEGKPDKEEPEKPGKPGKVPEVIKGIIIGLLVAAAVAVVAYAVVILLPAVVTLILSAVSAAVLFLVGVVAGVITIIIAPGRPQPVLPGEVARILGDAMKTDRSRLGQEAVTFLGTVEGAMP